MLADRLFPYTSEFYKALPCISTASDELEHSSARDSFFNEAAHLYRTFFVSPIFGLALLHKHYDCRPNEIALESYREIESSPSLVTSATVRKNISAHFQPTLWKFCEFGMTPLEFALDDCLPEATEKDFAEISPEFFSGLNLLLKKYDFSNLFGFCVAERPYYKTSAANHVAIESSDVLKRENIVSLQDCAAVTDQLVETCWTFSDRDQATLSCPKVCKLYCYDLAGHKRGHYNIHASA